MTAKCAVEGWLIKKKAKDRNAFFSKDNLRYFKIQEVRGQDYAELAFAYFKTQKDKEARGWIYLKDITEIYDDERAFTVVSAARTMIIEAQNPTEYLMWLQTLVEYCPHADTSGLRTEVSSSKKRSDKTVQSKDTSDDAFQTLDALQVQHPPAGNKKSFSKSVSLFSRQADGENNSFYLPSQGIHKVYSSSHSDIEGVEQPSASHTRQLLDDSDGDNDGVSGPSGPSSHSRTNSREFSNNQYNRGNQDREDHRKQGYRGSSGTSGTTNRLHQHISKENSNGVASSSSSASRNKKDLHRIQSELEEISVENSTTVGNRYAGQRVGVKVDSNGSMGSLAEGLEDDVDYDGAESESNGHSPVGNNHSTSNTLMYSNESMVDPDGNPLENFAASGERGSLKKMHAANMSIHFDSKELAAAAPAPVSKPAGSGTGKRGMPTSAPPKKAVESLNQVEAVINSADPAGSGKTRISIDELLYRKKVNNSADSKPGDDSRGRGNKSSADDSDEEEVDFKAEMRHYSNNVTASTESVLSSGSAAVSKPPRAPMSNKSPYTNPGSGGGTTSSGHQPSHVHGVHPRSNTPPRRPQDPGAKIDSNFVTDNWDEDDDSDEDQRGNTRFRGGAGARRGAGGKGHASSAAQQQPHRAEDKAVAGRDQYGNAVKQDENWLEENFDDD